MLANKQAGVDSVVTEVLTRLVSVQVIGSDSGTQR